MRAFELYASIDSDGRLSAQLPTAVKAADARVIVLLDDATTTADKTQGRPLSFAAARINTQGYRFRPEPTDER